MEYLTTEEIAEKTDHKAGLANIRAINRLYRIQDESMLFPIKGKFDATERAIRQARLIQHDTGAVYGYEYCCLLDCLISDIVNKAL